MCLGGGNNAQKAAQEQEKQRQAAISQNVSAIDAAYGNRQPQYDQFSQALRTKYNQDLQLQQQGAERNSRFAIARSGLTGGSAAVDTGATLSREASQGALTAEQQVQKATAGLKSQDQASRLQLISLAQSGSDIGNAAQQTAEALQANAQGAKASGLATGLGDAFGNTAQIYKQQQDAQKLRQGYADAKKYANPFSSQ